MPEEFQAVLDSDPEGTSHFSTLTDGKKRSLIYYILRFNPNYALENLLQLECTGSLSLKI